MENKLLFYPYPKIVHEQMEKNGKRVNLPRLVLLEGFARVYHKLGREEEARAYITEAIKLNPNLSLDYVKMTFQFFKDPAHLQRMLDAYRKVGLPEKAPMVV